MKATFSSMKTIVQKELREFIRDRRTLMLALVLGPGARIDLLPSLTVVVSIRSLRGAAQRRRRMARAIRTLRVNWRDAPPWERWAVTITGSRRPTRDSTSSSQQ